MSIGEKPARQKSGYVVPWLYCHDEGVADSSVHGEFEITDINRLHLVQGNCGGLWDAGCLA